MRALRGRERSPEQQELLDRFLRDFQADHLAVRETQGAIAVLQELRVQRASREEARIAAIHPGEHQATLPPPVPLREFVESATHNASALEVPAASTHLDGGSHSDADSAAVSDANSAIVSDDEVEDLDRFACFKTLELNERAQFRCKICRPAAMFYFKDIETAGWHIKGGKHVDALIIVCRQGTVWRCTVRSVMSLTWPNLSLQERATIARLKRSGELPVGIYPVTDPKSAPSMMCTVCQMYLPGSSHAEQERHVRTMRHQERVLVRLTKTPRNKDLFSSSHSLPCTAQESKPIRLPEVEALPEGVSFDFLTSGIEDIFRRRVRGALAHIVE